MKTMARIALIGSLLFSALALSLSPVNGQVGPNEREVRTDVTDKDKSDVWTLDFKFKDPRIIKLYVPGQGTRVYWYLWYQVINRTGKPRQFVPYFEIVTLDYPAVFPDNNYPTVEQAIMKIEDPTGYQNIKNSVTISDKERPIPMSLPDAFPRPVTGLAIWEAASTVNPKKINPKVKELCETSHFSIFVRGLSNGFVIVNPLVSGQPSVTRFKTLQLNFRRTGDRFSIDSRDISFVSPAEWLYRPGSSTLLNTK